MSQNDGLEQMLYREAARHNTLAHQALSLVERIVVVDDRLDVTDPRWNKVARVYDKAIKRYKRRRDWSRQLLDMASDPIYRYVAWMPPRGK